MAKLKVLAVELKPEDHQKLKEFCKEKQIAMAVYVRDMIKKVLKEGEKK
jgi:predicted DNA-binding protein